MTTATSFRLSRTDSGQYSRQNHARVSLPVHTNVFLRSFSNQDSYLTYVYSPITTRYVAMRKSERERELSTHLPVHCRFFFAHESHACLVNLLLLRGSPLLFGFIGRTPVE